MDKSDLIDAVFAQFAKASEWPHVRDLQRHFGPRVNVRLVAAELGPRIMVCEEGPEGVCRLTLDALSSIPGAATDLDTLAAALRFACESYLKNGPEPITHLTLRDALRLSDSAQRRLGFLLRSTYGPWVGLSSSPDGMQYSITPNDDAAFFGEIQNYSDLKKTQNRLDEERRRIAQLHSAAWVAAEQPAARLVDSTGWEKVDRQLNEVRTRLATARTEEQCQAVGLLCREVLISVAEAAHDVERHPLLDVTTVSPTDMKRRLSAFFAAELAGSANSEARSHAKAAVTLALALQHKRTADYRTAAICAEATWSVATLASIAANYPRDAKASRTPPT